MTYTLATTRCHLCVQRQNWSQYDKLCVFVIPLTVPTSRSLPVFFPPTCCLCFCFRASGTDSRCRRWPPSWTNRATPVREGPIPQAAPSHPRSDPGVRFKPRDGGQPILKTFRKKKKVWRFLSGDIRMVLGRIFSHFQVFLMARRLNLVGVWLVLFHCSWCK